MLGGWLWRQEQGSRSKRLILYVFYVREAVSCFFFLKHSIRPVDVSPYSFHSMMDLLHTLVALSIAIISNSGICTPYNYSPIEKLLILEHQGPWRLAVKFMISNAVVMSLRVFPFTEFKSLDPRQPTQS